MEKIDIAQTYSEIDESIKKEDHERVLSLADRILKADPKEKEAFQCKILALINLSKNEDILNFIEKSSMQKELLLEYAYSLHDKKKYAESVAVLNQYASSRKDITNSINELLAQNFYKMGNFKDSYKMYREMIESKIKSQYGDLEEDRDLITNFLASYVYSEANEESFLQPLMKFLNTWESFFNYCLICLKQGKFNESMETLYRIKRDFPQQGDDDIKNLNLNIIQTSFEGFEYAKVSTILDEYEKILSGGKTQELLPYFYNNFLHIKKDKDSLNETLKKLDNFLKNESLMKEEKQKITINKIILLLRANRLNEANELFKSLENDHSNPLLTIIYCYIYLKQEKTEKFEEFLKNDSKLRNKPEAHLILIQMMISTLSSKNIEQFHLKVLNFIKEFFEYTINFHFLNFFIGFYESRHMKDYLKEFVRNYKDPVIIYNSAKNKDVNPKLIKRCMVLLGRSFYTVGLYEESANFFSFVLENVNKSLDHYENDLSLKLELMNSLAHINSVKSDEIRRQVDETMIDMSLDHFNSLVSEMFSKNKRNQGEKKKTKKKKKKRFPKNFDPKKPGQLPDPERWLPKLQRKKYRNIAKNKMAYQGASADHSTTTTHFKK